MKDLILAKKYLQIKVKPENILLNNNVIKIADFGFAKEIPSEVD